SYDPKSIAVKFAFPRAEESLVISENYRIRIDLSNIKPSPLWNYEEINYPATLSDIVGPREATRIIPVQFVDTARVSLRVKLYVVRARVVPRIVGTPAAGYQVLWEKIEVDPPTSEVAV